MGAVCEMKMPFSNQISPSYKLIRIHYVPGNGVVTFFMRKKRTFRTPMRSRQSTKPTRFSMAGTEHRTKKKGRVVQHHTTSSVQDKESTSLPWVRASRARYSKLLSPSSRIRTITGMHGRRLDTEVSTRREGLMNRRV